MNLLLFIISLTVMFIIERIGAVAFELTGLEWSTAKFQALSCFTGTGFTTKDSELVVSSPQRRKIASILMILGHAGVVTLVATFANTLRDSPTFPKIFDIIPGHFAPLINLVIIAILVFIIFKIFNSSGVSQRLTNWLKRRIMKRNLIKPVSFEELSLAGNGFGLCQLEIWEKSPLIGQKISEIIKKNSQIKILMISKGSHPMKLTTPDTVINRGDKVLCFGKIENMKHQLHVEDSDVSHEKKDKQ